MRVWLGRLGAVFALVVAGIALACTGQDSEPLAPGVETSSTPAATVTSATPDSVAPWFAVSVRILAQECDRGDGQLCALLDEFGQQADDALWPPCRAGDETACDGLAAGFTYSDGNTNGLLAPCEKGDFPACDALVHLWDFPAQRHYALFGFTCGNRGVLAGPSCVEQFTPVGPLANPDLIFVIKVAKPTPCCETLERGPGRIDPSASGFELGSQAEWRKKHPAMVDAAELFIALRNTRSDIALQSCTTALLMARESQYATAIDYLSQLGTGSSGSPEELVMPEAQAGTPRITISDLKVSRVEGPRYSSGDLSVASYGYDIRARVEVAGTGESALVSVSAKFPNKASLEEIGSYFGGGDFWKLARQMHRYLQPLLDLPCA